MSAGKSARQSRGPVRLPGQSARCCECEAGGTVMKNAPVVLNQACGIKQRLRQTRVTWKSQFSSVKVFNHRDELQPWLSCTDCSLRVLSEKHTAVTSSTRKDIQAEHLVKGGVMYGWDSIQQQLFYLWVKRFFFFSFFH